jgi:outer membrane protein assembly factor BamE (lipoprotein component of BamABCDE complex)
MTRLAAVLPLLLCGCLLTKSKDDFPLAPEDVARIEVGKTTKAEILQILGPPKQIVRLLDSEAFVYQHTIQKSTGLYLAILNLQRADKQHDAVTVIVDRKGVVTAVGSRFLSDRARYATPWAD